LKKRRLTRKQKLEALARASEQLDRETIRRRLALPVEKRANFLRRLVGIGGASTL
jgi:hypothetical protein